MQDKHKHNTSQLFNYAEDSYLERSSRPIYALLFLLPFIIFYELGTIFINTDVLNQTQVRVVAFVWLQNMLEYIGFGDKLTWAAPAIVVLIILISLQLASRKSWSFVFADVAPMSVECILYSIPLIVLSLFINSSVGQQDVANSALETLRMQTGVVQLAAENISAAPQEISQAPAAQNLLANIVTGVGAGIYEELVFRLVLIIILMLIFQDLLRLSHTTSIICSVLLSAILFSAHHHIFFLDGQFGQSSPFDLMAFGFRILAGVYFAVLFAVRGFGITAGTHAFYDIIAVLINSLFFQH